MINFKSPYYKYASKTLNWFAMDSQELYIKNLKNDKNSLIENNWIRRKVTYSFNSHGFRCDEFNNNPTLMTLGCSITCGIGLPIEDTWSNIVSNTLNLRCANMGIGAHSNDTAFRLCYGWIDIIKPKIVIFLQTFPNRLEVISKDEFINLGIWNADPNDIFYNNWTSTYDNDELNKLKNTLAIQNLCNQRNIKFLTFSADDLYSHGIKADLARDLVHPGTKSNFNFARHILKFI